MPKKVYIPGIVDPHVHFRGMAQHDHEVMRDLISLSRRGGAIITLPMPNTEPELTNAALVGEYHRHLESFAGNTMTFIRAAMLTERTTRAEVIELHTAGVRDVKIYPRDRTTKSEKGVRDYINVASVLQQCGALGIRVHVHPEHPWMQFDNRDAEFAFLSTLDMLLGATEDVNTVFVWEHGTDGRCIPFWKEMAKTGRFYVTLTAHHLATDEDESFGDVRCVCKPTIKTRRDRSSLIELVAEGHQWVMAGSDFAPHPMDKKHVHSGRCACGACTGPDLASLYAHALDEIVMSSQGASLMRRFLCSNALRLYKLRKPETRLVIERTSREIPPSYKAGNWTVEPFWAKQTIYWSHQWL